MKSLNTILMATFVLNLGACTQSVTEQPNTVKPLTQNHALVWGAEDNPQRFDADLVFVLADLPTEGEADVAPWAGSYWPIYQDSINHRWAGEHTLSPAAKFGQAFGIEGIEDKVSAYHGIDSMEIECAETAECDDELGEVCAKREGAETGRCIATWFGICHAWAPAAILEPEPIHPVTHNGVTFQPNDLKALMSLLYNRTDSTMLSLRCNVDGDDIELDEFGNPTGDDAPCRDTNAGTMHVIMANYLGLRGQAFVEDRTYDYEVWNQPVRAFRVNRMLEVTPRYANRLAGYAGADIPETYAFNENATQLYYVESELDYITESPSFLDGNLSNRIDDFTRTDRYTYILEVNENGKIIGGEWTGASKTSHPDFLWLPSARQAIPVAGGNITYATVRNLLEESIAPREALLSPVTVEHAFDLAQGQWAHFGPFDVAAGQLVASITSDVDADLYVRKSEQPTIAEFSCRPYLGHGNEQCSVAGPAQYYVSVHGYAPGHVDLSITYLSAPAAAPEEPEQPDAELEVVPHQVDLDGHVATREWVHFGPFENTAGVFDVNMTGAGDADLYVRRDAQPTTADYDCRPYKGSSDEQCSIDEQGVWYVSVRGYSEADYALVINFEGPNADEQDAAPEPGDVDPEVPEAPEVPEVPEAPEANPGLQTEGALGGHEWAHFGPFEVQDGELVATMTGTGDADLYVRRDAQPTTSHYDCRPYTPNSDESCTIAGPGVFFVSIRGYQAATYQLNVTITGMPSPEADDAPIPEIAPDAEPAPTPAAEVDALAPLETSGHVAQGEMALYSVPMHTGQTFVVRTQAPNDVDLYLKFGEAPSTGNYALRAYSISGNETLEYTAVSDGILHIGVYGYRASDFELTAGAVSP